jgi:hypothetical protein
MDPLDLFQLGRRPSVGSHPGAAIQGFPCAERQAPISMRLLPMGSSGLCLCATEPVSGAYPSPPRRQKGVIPMRLSP